MEHRLSNLLQVIRVNGLADDNPGPPGDLADDAALDSDPHATCFAPAERCDPETLQQQWREVTSTPMLSTFLDSLPEMVLVLNSRRQIVHVNRALTEFLHNGDATHLVGLRPGEALNCQHSNEPPNGCGTTDFCRYCGAVKAILTAEKGHVDTQECRITTKAGDALDLKVWATPISIADERMTIFVVSDISSQKRKQALERIFFHDLLNTAGGLQGYAEILAEADEDERQEFSAAITRLAGKLIEEIKTQRDLASAEENDLAVTVGRVHTGEFLTEMIRMHKGSDIASGRFLQTRAGSAVCTLTTDRTLLSRIVGNMVRNALEASSAGQMVTLACEQDAERGAVTFAVHNPGYMSELVQRQVFNRSFTTKGKGRGLGSYAMKLLGERYLQGKVSFTTDPEEGTTFRIELPVSYTPA